MCLAIPGRIKEMLPGKKARIEFLGVEKEASLDLLENIQVGDYVIVHAGFAINKINQEQANATISHLRELCRE